MSLHNKCNYNVNNINEPRIHIPRFNSTIMLTPSLALVQHIFVFHLGRCPTSGMTVIAFVTG